MSSVLFVDDDANVLEGLRDLLRPHRRRWEMSFELSPERGLARLAESPVDVVVSDMKMPGVDGIAFLADVRRLHPEAVRVVLSGHSEPGAAIGSTGVAHRFLAKPCRAADLVDVLESALHLRSLLVDPAIRRATGGLRSLPSAPAAYRALTEALADPEAALERVAAVIESDVGMCAKVLQLVNSSFFGLGRRITSVGEATVYLGVETLRTLVLAGETFREFDDAQKNVPYVRALEDHALAIAQATGALVEGAAARSEAFMAGMLHDVGKLVLASELTDEYGRVVASSAERGLPQHVVEHEVWGFTHADVGAYLLAVWGLPTAAVEAARNHHTPHLASEEQRHVVEAVAAAHTLVRAHGQAA